LEVAEVWTRVPPRLIRDVGFFLVPAGRTWDRVVSFGSELFRRVVASGNGQPPARFQGLNAVFDRLQSSIGSDKLREKSSDCEMP
jgi:hypothetical protein